MPGQLIQIAANAVNAKLISTDRDLKLAVSEMLSYEVEGAARTDRFKAGHWDGRSSFFEFRSGMFPAGFIYMVARELTRLGHRVQHVTKPVPEPLGPEIGTFDPWGYGWSARYDHQPETIRRLLRHKRMIAQVATGGGKSRIAVLTYATIRRPTLFLTTRSVLMHQMADGFAAAGFIAGVMGDGIWKPRRGVNVGMVQSIMARLKETHPERDRTLALLAMFEVVIGEEAHEAGGNGYYEVMTHCRNAHYRLALTATPFMRADGEANMRLQAAFGSVGIEITEKALIDSGILATPTFRMASVAAPALLRRSTPWPACYDIGIVENEERNKLICQEAHRAVSHGLPVLILVQRERHGELLRAMLKQAGVKALFRFGKHEQDERGLALRALRAGAIDVLIGSTILDVGVDVPGIGMVILAGGMKAEVGHRQRIGRGLREKPWNECFVLDFEDRGNKHLHAHAQTRRGILEATPGFKERILRPGADFPWETVARLATAA